MKTGSSLLALNPDSVSDSGFFYTYYLTREMAQSSACVTTGVQYQTKLLQEKKYFRIFLFQI